MRVLLLGGTGTIGQATAAALVQAGHEVTALVRPGARRAIPGVTQCTATVTDPASVREALAAWSGEAIVSCLASRTGAPADAWAIDHAATLDVLAAARDRGATRVVLLSAICVQRPRLAFQYAKLAAEAGVRASGLTWSIVRPTAFFKSLSGQIDRLRAGKPFLLFGDGRGTACKPISDADLARFLADCLTRPDRANRVLPIGGPGPALTPHDQGTALFDALGLPPKFSHVPLRLMDVIVGALTLGGRVAPPLRDRAELARIGRYYATESMLLWDPAAGRYDAAATPETGTDTLPAFYCRLARGQATVDRGAHAVF